MLLIVKIPAAPLSLAFEEREKMQQRKIRALVADLIDYEFAFISRGVVLSPKGGEADTTVVFSRFRTLSGAEIERILSSVLETSWEMIELRGFTARRRSPSDKRN